METKTEEKLTREKNQKNIADTVLARVQQFQNLGELRLPKNYDAGNALKSAWLILQETRDKDNRPVLEEGICTKNSIANALFEMVITGLSPMKKQCSFIAYGNKLTFQKEYAGTIALVKRFGGVIDISANVVYEGDEFRYLIDSTTGKMKIETHVQEFKNIAVNKILGAYATLILNDGSTETEIMSIAQIRQAWLQGKSKGNSPAHKNFPDQMAKKTVIYRACKLRINSSDDQVLGQSKDKPDPALSGLKDVEQIEDVEFDEVKEELNSKAEEGAETKGENLPAKAEEDVIKELESKDENKTEFPPPSPPPKVKITEQS